MAYEWNFEKLPKERHNEVIALVKQGSGGKLMVIHNQYQLSDELYCCSVQDYMVLNWFKHGIETGQITGNGQSLPE